MPLKDFDALQGWTQDALLGPAPDVADVARRVKPSATLDAAARLEIYRRMIAARFAGVVEADFPATRALLGAARFDALAARYVARSASRSFTLDGYAARFPAFLGAEGESAAAELARYEAVLEESRDALPEPGVDAAALAAIPAEAWPTMRALPAAGFRLFDAAYAVDVAYAAWLADRPVRAPARRASHYAVFRTDRGVVRLRLGRRARAFVAALADESPLCVAAAAARAAGLRSDELRRLSARLVGAGGVRAFR